MKEQRDVLYPVTSPPHDRSIRKQLKDVCMVEGNCIGLIVFVGGGGWGAGAIPAGGRARYRAIRIVGIYEFREDTRD